MRKARWGFQGQVVHSAWAIFTKDQAKWAEFPCKFREPNVTLLVLLWMDKILHHFEAIRKPLFVGIYQRIIIPGFLRWCRILSIHSMLDAGKQAEPCTLPQSTRARLQFLAILGLGSSEQELRLYHLYACLELGTHNTCLLILSVTNHAKRRVTYRYFFLVWASIETNPRNPQNWTHPHSQLDLQAPEAKPKKKKVEDCAALMESSRGVGARGVVQKPRVSQSLGPSPL